MSDDIRVSLMNVLSEYYPSLKKGGKGFLLILFSMTGCINITFAVILLKLNGSNSNKWYSDFIYQFENSSVDCLLISLMEIILLPLVAYIAVQVGKPKEYRTLLKSTADISLKNQKCDCFRCFYGLRRGKYFSVPTSNQKETDGDTFMRASGLQPLLASRQTELTNFDPSNSTEETIPAEFEDDTSTLVAESLEGYEHEILRQKKSGRSLDEKYLNMKKTSDLRKGICLGALFIFSAFFQIYIGLKCINFAYSDEVVEGSLMGLGVLWVNIMTWTLRELVLQQTADEGEYIPSLHPHHLHLHTSLASHWCDLCHQQCKEGRAFRCKLCDFDLCMVCYSKKDSSSSGGGASAFTLEGQLRGDKGIRSGVGGEDLSRGDKYFFRALKLVYGERYIFTIGMIFLLASNGVSLFMPNIQGSVLNSVVDGDNGAFHYWVLIYLIMSVCSGLIGGIQSLCFSVVGRRLSNTIRKGLYAGIVVQDVAFFDGNSSGHLTSRLTNDVSFMVSPIQSMLGTLLSNSILLVGGMALCFSTSWRLSMLAFTTVGPIVHITQVYADWSKHLNRQIYGALAAANGYATEALGNIRTVKAFSNEEFEKERYSDANDNALMKGIRDAFGGAGMYTINSYLELGAAVLILWYGGLMAMDHRDGMSPGKLITYQLYWNMLNNSYKNLLDIVTSFTRSSSAAQRVFSLMDSLPDIDIHAGRRIAAADVKGNILFRNLSFAYQMRPNAKVLDNICLNIPAGTTCALVGPSGGGKSTLVNLIMRFYDPMEGSIVIDGSDLTALCLKDLRRQIGVVQQNTELFAGTIEENITYGMDPGTWSREEVIAAAKQACAHDFIKQFPEGYLTRVGERGVRISGGQKQRIAIARVFLRKPRILLLDEATSALDAESEARVQEALDKLITSSDFDSCKRTIVLVAHRLSTVIYADQIAVVHSGRVVELGKHEDLIALGGEYAKLVQRQVKKKESTLVELPSTAEGNTSSSSNDD